MAKKRRQRTKHATPATPSPTPKQGRRSKTAWKLMDRSTTLAATVAAPVLAGGAWRLVTGRKPPTASDNPEVELREAIGWAIVGGALVQVVKVAVVVALDMRCERHGVRLALVGALLDAGPHHAQHNASSLDEGLVLVWKPQVLGDDASPVAHGVAHAA